MYTQIFYQPILSVVALYSSFNPYLSKQPICTVLFQPSVLTYIVSLNNNIWFFAKSKLVPDHIWQMDVTHYAEFGKLKYIRLY